MTPPPPAVRVTVGTGRVVAVGVMIATALVGVLIGGWLCYSAATGARVIVFATGSMSPTLPQGAAAVSLPVTADEIQVGDVVTVQRDDAHRPVTHRVVSVAPAQNDPDARELVLQGDDNDTPDLGAYVVREAHRVAWGGPELGALARGLRHPVIRTVLWAGAAGAVLWALWPASVRREDA